MGKAMTQKQSQKEQELPTCHYCQKTWKKQGDLTRHLATHEAIDDRKYACTECPKKFSQATNLKSHLNTHTGAKPHTCRYDCESSFGDDSSRGRHEHDVHEPYYGWQCDKCEHMFKRRKHYENHQSSIHNYKPTTKEFSAAKKTHRDNYMELLAAEKVPPLEIKVKEPKRRRSRKNQFSSTQASPDASTSSPQEVTQGSFTLSGDQSSHGWSGSGTQSLLDLNGPENTPILAPSIASSPSLDPRSPLSQHASVASTEPDSLSSSDFLEASMGLLARVSNPFGMAPANNSFITLYATPRSIGAQQPPQTNGLVLNVPYLPRYHAHVNGPQLASPVAPQPELNPTLFDSGNSSFNLFSEGTSTSAYQATAVTHVSYHNYRPDNSDGNQILGLNHPDALYSPYGGDVAGPFA
ncbi:hypothetical protein FRC12_012732 [Ceratobasidium sp. 428]|nr:hypothetical protein FRC12_012732 [Ceratobasidium sp. 428]